MLCCAVLCCVVSVQVPNASPTAGSASTDLYGMAVLDACRQINERLKPYRCDRVCVFLCVSVCMCVYRSLCDCLGPAESAAVWLCSNTCLLAADTSCATP